MTEQIELSIIIPAYNEEDRIVPTLQHTLAYLGTRDMRQVETKIQQGHENARLLLQAMAYQIAKDIGAMSTVLNGKVDAIVLTGGLANSAMLVDSIADRVKFIAPVKIFPDEQEMLSLAAGALRVLAGTETIKHYGLPG